MSDDDGRARGRRQPAEGDHLGDELLSRLVDGDLTPAERRSADAHLLACATCRSSLDALRSTVTLLQGLPSPRPARSFQLAPSHQRPAGWRRFSGWLTAEMPALRAAVLTLVLILGGITAFGVLRDDGDQPGDVRMTGQAEPTVGDAEGAAPPTVVATLPGQAVDQTPVDTPAPTPTPEPPGSRSGPPVEAAEIATKTPEPTLERESIFGIEEEAPAADESADVATTRATDEVAPGDADEATEAAATDDAVIRPTITEASGASADGDAEKPSADAASTEPATEAPSNAPVDQADEDDEPGAEAGEASSDASSDAESDTTTSAAFAVDTPTATASPSPTARSTSTRTATPVGSPVASPLASPVGTPVASSEGSVTGQEIPFDDVAVDTMTPRRIDAMLALAVLATIGGLVVAVRATRGSQR